MQIDKVREQIVEIISTDSDTWNKVLTDTSPGNYGCDSWEVDLDFNDVFVDIPKRTFTLKNGNFQADLVMGASKGDKSFNESYCKSFSAKGTFDFDTAKQVKIIDIIIDIDRDIYSE